MRLAVLSDIHGNQEAFSEVLEDIQRADVQSVVSLGDNIGYGPDSRAVVEMLQDRRIPSVMGNHELGLSDPASLEWFNVLARKSLKAAEADLTADALAFCRGLPPLLIVSGCRCVHGCPPDSIMRYLFEPSDLELADIIARLEQDICFVGHTHLLEIIRIDGAEVEHLPLRPGIRPLPSGCRYIINAGSVGQPRDGDNRAKYLIWDDEARTLEVRVVPYDFGTTVKKILARGLPDINARRLM